MWNGYCRVLLWVSISSAPSSPGPLGLSTPSKRATSRLLSPYLFGTARIQGEMPSITSGLVPPSVPVVDAFSRIEKTLSDRLGPPSEWGQTLTGLYRGFVPRPPRPYIDLPVLVADCIIAASVPLFWRRRCLVHAEISCVAFWHYPPAESVTPRDLLLNWLPGWGPKLSCSSFSSSPTETLSVSLMT